MKASFVHENKQKVTKECACSRNTLYLGVYICIVVSMIHIQLEHQYYINISIDFIKKKIFSNYCILWEVNINLQKNVVCQTGGFGRNLKDPIE